MILMVLYQALDIHKDVARINSLSFLGVSNGFVANNKNLNHYQTFTFRIQHIPNL